MNRTLLAILAINLFALVALGWADTERLHVTIVDSGGSVTGLVGPVTLTVPADPASAGKIGLFLQGVDPHATFRWTSPVSADVATRPTLENLLYRAGTESAWDNVQVTDLVTGQRLFSGPGTGVASWQVQFGDWFRHPLGGLATSRPGLITAGLTSWRRYQIDADLLRPRHPAGVLVLSPDGANGLLLYLRPEDRDVVWYRVANGQWQGPLASAPYRAFRKAGPAAVQDVLRLALGSYPAAVALLAIMAALGRLEVWLASRLAGGRGFSSIRGGESEPPDVPPALAADHARRSTREPRMPSGESTADPHRTGVAREARMEMIDAPWGPELAGDAIALLASGAPGGEDSRPRSSSWRAVARARGGMSAVAAAGRARLAGRAEAAAASILTFAALASTLYVADAVLQRMPHVQDSVAYLFQAKTFALGRLSVPAPAHPEFFTHEFIVMKDGQWFSKYPPGWPMLLALGVIIQAPWVIDPICGALSIFLVYRLGAEIYRPRVGLLAAALGVLSPFFLFLSGSMMSHTSGLLFTLLFVWALRRLERSERPLGFGLLAGSAFGMGFLIRPFTMAVIALPFILYLLYRAGRRPRASLRQYLPALVAALPFIAAFFAYNAHFTGNPFYPPQQLWWEFDRLGFGPDHGPWGFTVVDGLNNTSRNLWELLEHTYGWPAFLTLALALIPFMTGQPQSWDGLLGAGVLALVAGYACWWADGIMYGPRFYFEGLGFLLLLTARGVDVLFEWARRGGRLGKWLGQRAPAVVTPLLAFGLVVGLMAFNAFYYFPGQWQLYHGYNYVNHGKLDAVEQAGIHHALVFASVGQPWEWWEYGMVFSANDPLLQGDVIFARDLGPAADRRLLADFPGRAAYRLVGTRLVPFTP